MEIPILKDMLVILGLGTVVMFVFSRLKIPTIVGFLLTGIVAGPYGFGLVNAVKEVEVMAEIGVILLLFSLGLEFSFKRLLKLKQPVLVGGTLQVLLTFLAVMFGARYFNLSRPEAVFLGFLAALSSTAIVIKLLQERGATDTPHGRISIGILIFQDIIIVPMMMLIPFLAGASGETGFSLLRFSGQIAFLLVIIYTGSKWLVPFLLKNIAASRNRELFLLSIAFLVFSIAWMTSWMGLSLALGAFLAGLIVSETEYSHSAFGHILPFRDIFMSFFFVSVGMLLNVRTIISNPEIVILVAAGVIVLKLLTGGIATLFLRYPMRTLVLAVLPLAQIGEFSFILSREGLKYNLISDTAYQIFLAVSILTMMATPFVMLPGRFADRIISFLPLPGFLKAGKPGAAGIPSGPALVDHLIIIGFGENGRHLAGMARKVNIPFIVIDLNPATVLRESKEGIPIFFGDATQQEILQHAGIGSARIVVLALNDPDAALRITQSIRGMNPKVQIVVRTRYIQDVPELQRLGASEIVPEEYETSVELSRRVLKHFSTAHHKIDQLISEFRAQITKPV